MIPSRSRPHVNVLLAAGLGAALAGPLWLWRPDLVQAAGLWPNGRGVALPWQRSCPVPASAPAPGSAPKP